MRIAKLGLALSVLGLVASAAAFAEISLGYTGSEQSGPIVINKVLSGLVASDPFTQSQTQQQLQSNQSYWLYGGDAQTVHASYSFYQDANQLHIGVSATNIGNWAGFYAETPSTNASLVHAVLTAPSSSLPGYYDNGLYVQASNQLLNYVACLSVTAQNGTIWAVVHGVGYTGYASQILPLWVDKDPNQKLSQGCTISTDGTNYLRVYLDNRLVYQNDALQLGMPGPFNFYVESQTQYTSNAVFGGFQDFYATLGENVKVTDIPATAVSAVVVDSNGTILAASPVESGTANLGIGQYTFPMTAYIKLYSSSETFSNSTLVGSTQSAVNIYGGDIFAVGASGLSTFRPTLTISAVDSNGNDLNGMYVTLSQNRNMISSDFTPTSFQLNNSQTYTVMAADYGAYTFDHWSDGSTLRAKTLSISSNTALTAVYRSVGDVAPQGKSILRVTATDSSGKSLSGLYVSVWQDGTLMSASSTPTSVLVNDGTTYQIIVSSYGNYNFDHWSDGFTNPMRVWNTSSPAGLNLVAIYNASS
ncbi:MAG: hypothetical protein ACYC7D_00745 [Nitrososphaerales archaeon]